MNGGGWEGEESLMNRFIGHPTIFSDDFEANFTLEFKDDHCRKKRTKTNDKTEAAKPSSDKSEEWNACQPPKQDYVHVRARRGQATDSHSLAERFLSMKLEAANSRMNSGYEVFLAKDFGQPTFDGMAYGPQASRGPSPEWLHMQVGGGFQRTSY